jgi:hypothetical protein
MSCTFLQATKPVSWNRAAAQPFRLASFIGYSHTKRQSIDTCEEDAYSSNNNCRDTPQ